ncbi:hypothetical protein Aut01nite_34930 [Actinoplanes utahensis]|nr:hypothetical protein Aut01nite_34930 [Actinoplanes utahensis]
MSSVSRILWHPDRQDESRPNRRQRETAMKSLAFRVISGAIAASVLLVLPATASSLLAAPSPGTRVAEGVPVSPGTRAAEGVPVSPGTRAAEGVPVAASRTEVVAAGSAPTAVRAGARLTFRLVVPGATAQGAYELPGDRTGGGTADGARPAADRPGAGRPGTDGDRKPRVTKPDGRITITLKVTGGTRCGVLQTTTNGPADGIEWYTFGVLCKPGTATFRTEANRLPWSAATLPSVRLCNGLSPALAEGDECDGYEPPRNA